MFSLDQVNDIHERLGSADTLPQYLAALNEIGVEKYDSFIIDGHSEYFDNNNNTVKSPPAHEALFVAETGNLDRMNKCLKDHSEGKTSYIQMSKGLAESGIEKWTFDTSNMTITYCDKAGNEMLTENLS